MGKTYGTSGGVEITDAVVGRLAVRAKRGLDQTRLRSRAANRDGAAEELRAVVARVAAELARSHPELVDRSGRIRRRALEAALRERLGGRGSLTGEEFDRLVTAGLSVAGEKYGRTDTVAGG